MAWSSEDRQRFADRDVLKARTVPAKRREGPSVEEWDALIDDDEELVPFCDLENPESCESCQ